MIISDKKHNNKTERKQASKQDVEENSFIEIGVRTGVDKEYPKGIVDIESKVAEGKTNKKEKNVEKNGLDYKAYEFDQNDADPWSSFKKWKESTKMKEVTNKKIRTDSRILTKNVTKNNMTFYLVELV